jgi:hypothetical protein
MVSNRTQYPNLLQTKYEYTVYLFIQGRQGGGESLTREKGRGAKEESTDPKAGLKIPT